MTRTHQRYSDERLAEHLAAGQTVAAAARAAGMSERSAYRRKKQPAVRDRINEVRRAALDTAATRLDHAMVTACDRLIGLLGHANPHVQIRAAQVVIQTALKVRHEADLADRLDEREEQARRPGVSPELPGQCPPAPVSPDSDSTDRPQLTPPITQPAPGDDPVRPTEFTAASAETAPVADVSGPGRGPTFGPAPPAERPTAAGGPDRNRRCPAPRIGAVAGVILALAALSFAPAGAPRDRTEKARPADDTVRTCQNLTEPVTGGLGGPYRRVVNRVAQVLAPAVEGLDLGVGPDPSLAPGPGDQLPAGAAAG